MLSTCDGRKCLSVPRLACALGPAALPVLALAITLLLAPPGGAAAGDFPLAGVFQSVNPAWIYTTARENHAAGRFYSTTDLRPHGSISEALRQSFMPTDLSQNVQAAVVHRLHPSRLLATAVLTPLSIELQRQLVSGKGLDARSLVKALDPAVMASTLVGSLAGGVIGAAAQSTLASLGPVGAVAGFCVRQACGFGGSMLGYNIGRSARSGGARGARTWVADALRQIEPGRDTGQTFGYALGQVFGQALIPVPVVGGVIGGIIGSTLGTLIGTAVTSGGPLGELNEWIRRGLHQLADWIEGSGDPDGGTERTSADRPRPVTDRSAEVRPEGPSSMELLGVATAPGVLACP